MMYVFHDTKVADTLRDLGFIVFKAQYGAIGNYAVEKSDELDAILHEQFSANQFKLSPCLCF